MFIRAIMALIPMFILSPMMNWCLRMHGWDNLRWSWLVKGMLTIQVASGFIVELGWGMLLEGFSPCF